jgi:hypothetical protein
MTVAFPASRVSALVAASSCAALVCFAGTRVEAAQGPVIAPRRTAPSEAPPAPGGPKITSRATASVHRLPAVPPLPAGATPTFVPVATAAPCAGPIAPSPVAPYWPFGFYDFTRGPYSRYAGLFGYRGGYRSMYYVNGGYSFAYGPTWRF